MNKSSVLSQPRLQTMREPVVILYTVGPLSKPQFLLFNFREYHRQAGTVSTGSVSPGLERNAARMHFG
jgi:hypothetical protein